MLGNSLLRKAEVTILNGEATFKLPVEKNLLLEEFSGICLSMAESEADIPINVDHLNGPIKSQVVKAVKEYQLWRNVESSLKMSIVLKDDIPVYQRPRRLPRADQIIVEQQASEWRKEKIARPSSSEYASPNVLASKKDGYKKLCGDYRKLNQKIEHRPGVKMKHADARRRMLCSITESALTHRLRCSQERDDCTRAIRAVLKLGPYEDYFMRNGILYRDPQKDLIVVPVQLENDIIMLTHNQGHYGAAKTRELVEKHYYIPGIAVKVQKAVKSCVECIITEAKAGKKEGFLSPIYKEDRPLITYHLDHVGPMGITKKAYNQEETRRSIARIQEENFKTFNRNRKTETKYVVDELVAIKRTQFSTAMKLRGKFYGPYKIVEKLPHGRYEVIKVGSNDGPSRTTTVAENMKKWQSEPYCRQEGRM